MLSKNLNKILCVLIPIAVWFNACEIEHEVYDKINPGIYPLNAEEADALLMANVYNVFSGAYLFSTGWAWHTLSSLVTDEFEVNWASTYIGFDMTPQNDHFAGIGGYPVTDEINRGIPYYYSKFLSKMILTMERIKDVPMEEEIKTRMNAEIRCGMGFLAFLEYDLYGPIPLPGLDVLHNPLEDKVVPRATEQEMHQYIESNLLAAVNDLPYKYDATDYGRFTKGLAQMVLMKFYMLTKQWDKAEARGRELIKSEYGYGLVSDYNSLFTEAGEKNTEVIFSSINEFGAGLNLWPPHVLASDYPTPGQNLQKWGTFKLRWDFYHTFEPNDARTQRLIDEYVGTSGLVHNEVNDTKGEKGKNTLYYGPLPIKYDYTTAIGMESPVDIPMYRYADAITLLAEAIVRNGGSVTSEALKYLNDVRKRAKLLPYQLGDFATPEQFLDALLTERGHELWMEGHRRQDQIRHGVFIDACVAKGTKAGLPVARVNKMKQQTVSGKYDFERFPVPTGAINEGRGLIIQNPGY